jgi:YD repeat-containing protein
VELGLLHYGKGQTVGVRKQAAEEKTWSYDKNSRRKRKIS